MWCLYNTHEFTISERGDNSMPASKEELERKVQELESELEELKSSSNPKRRRRVTFEFSDETYQLLQRQAREKRTSMANIVRDAISRSQWLDETVSEGKLLLEEADGEIYRLKQL
jgi:predicted transcriptional regulator